MGVEIERKFLVDRSKWDASKENNGLSIRQGYLLKSIEKTVRVRTKGDKGYLTIKGKTTGASRSEFEYEIPYQEALEMLNTYCDKIIDKVRFTLIVDGKEWEIDEFSSPQEGLILAEIELDSEDEVFTIPEWVTEEVTSDPQYYNANMI
tara:strand:- start:9490 stop:9936 length:447 start_codon:yes stop_codon:yes gene_type:complete